MFKIVTEGVPTPHLLMMCDAACAQVTSAPVMAGTEKSPETHQKFIEVAIHAGWTFRLDKQFCPMHGARGSLIRLAGLPS